MTSPADRAARPFGPAVVLSVTLAIALAACASTGSARSSGPDGGGATASAAPSTGAVGPGSPGGDLGPGGSDGFVVPKPGQLDVHPIAADSLAAAVNGRHVVLTITYTSGVEPCSVLDSIVVQGGEGSFAITLRQGRGPGDQVCVMIARVMKTRVDLGDLDPGVYTISDTMGGADPIQVTVS